MDMKFYRCSVCGKIVAIVNSVDVPTICCGQEMEELVPGTIDASLEKHAPVWKQEGNKVTIQVGSTLHPATPEHHIEWIALQTKCGNQRKSLCETKEPKACFALCDGDEVVAVYAYCNLHGLWKA